MNILGIHTSLSGHCSFSAAVLADRTFLGDFAIGERVGPSFVGPWESRTASDDAFAREHAVLTARQTFANAVLDLEETVGATIR